MNFSALILAGGKSSRLEHTPKAGLSNGENTLLDCALAASSAARARVVVGPGSLPVPADTLHTREDPPFSGPAAGIHAGLEALAAHYETTGEEPAPWCLILGVDTPLVAPAVQLLLEHAESAPAKLNGFWGISEGVYQPLIGIYRFEPLRVCFARGTTDASVRRFLRKLEPQALELPAGSTRDVDTWEQAHELGFTQPAWTEYL
ncbi:MAG: NTP transferase domain-containing protein [Rothia sp. (in: high G+C Gram-positive bacteria)]|uniref:molybdenum cofactor guanylyltransferase n=1 Tax=Rothia sp. (in: high G+C Gram-positive bacteria) TaxID=1885016 RepID=UPI0026DFB11E|nr:NTP transferase domain-containing protein [Rothia sp. (in: high G+C Gram-positive bacteria)]MDO5749921.1 NTP transferase domain-containing protein [Rothia sp. (in: high G+C Gram-positive bacteria)]